MAIEIVSHAICAGCRREIENAPEEGDDGTCFDGYVFIGDVHVVDAFRKDSTGGGLIGSNIRTDGHGNVTEVGRVAYCIDCVKRILHIT